MSVPIFAHHTDQQSHLQIFADIRRCASSWVPEARIIGNVRAGDIVAAIDALTPDQPVATDAQAVEVLKDRAERARQLCLSAWMAAADTHGLDADALRKKVSDLGVITLKAAQILASPTEVTARTVAEWKAYESVCAEIRQIMQVYREQMERNGYVDTPGGLEHMGDVWRLFEDWDEQLVAATAPPDPTGRGRL